MKNKISRKNAIESKCHDCQAGYLDGKHDCEVVMCPIYPFMPYRRRTPNLDWQQYSPRRIGLVIWRDANSQEPLKNELDHSVNNFGSNTPTEEQEVVKRIENKGHTAQECEVCK